MQELQICFVSGNARDNEYLFRKEDGGWEWGGGILGEGECEVIVCKKINSISQIALNVERHKTCLKVHLGS